MQTGPVASLHAANDAEIAPFTMVKMTSGGVAAAGANDRPIGVVLPGDLNRNYPTIQLLGFYVEAIMGDGTDIAAGDELEMAADGKIVKKSTGNPIGVAVTAGTLVGDRIEAIVYGGPIPTPST